MSEIAGTLQSTSPHRPAVWPIGIGSARVTALSDGYFDLPFDFFHALQPDEAQALLQTARRPSPPRIEVNAFLVEQRGKRILVDTGCGANLGPTVNRLGLNLAAAGVTAASIDAILCTHIHPDHTNGLIDSSGQPVFPNAELYVHRAEAAFWLNDQTRAQAPDALKVQFDWAKAAFAPYANRMYQIASGEVLPGIEAVELPGHTPGHCGYVVHNDGQSLFIWGDAVHSISIQAAHPDVTFATDVDEQAARETRHQLFDRVAVDRLLIAGMHLEHPAFGHLTRNGNHFRYEPHSPTPLL